jgi:hypothetical protein
VIATVLGVQIARGSPRGDPSGFGAIRGIRGTGGGGKSELDRGRSDGSDLDAGAEPGIDGVLLHKRVADTQGAEYGGDDDGHVGHDDRHRRFHTT